MNAKVKKMQAMQTMQAMLRIKKQISLPG